MLRYLIAYYRRDLLKHPDVDAACRGLAENLKSPNNQKQLKRRKTNYERWDIMIETLIELLDEMA